MDTALLILLSAGFTSTESSYAGTRAPALRLAQGNWSRVSTAELGFSQQSSAHG